MKLVTWNVNSIRTRLPRVLELLEEHEPDVACLQETRADADAFPERELAAAGYECAHHSAGGAAGVALLARRPLELADVARGLPGERHPEEARWVEATIGGLPAQADVRVVSTYVPNGREVGSEPFEGKLAFLDAARERVAAAAADSGLIVAGDLNVCRTDADVYDPVAFLGSTHVTGEERSRLEALLEAGLVDCFRRLQPEGPGFTWWDYRAGNFHRHLGLRIDYVLATPGLAAGLRSCGIDRDYRKGPKPSDHAPLLAELAP